MEGTVQRFFNARFLGWLALVATLSIVSGCGDDSYKLNCPEADSTFIEKSVADFFARHQNPSGTRTYRLVGGNYYDTATHWWIVPLDADGQKLQALLSCDGRLELTGR